MNNIVFDPYVGQNYSNNPIRLLVVGESHYGFEDNDPNQPIIIGAYFHANEYSYAKYRPLELFPGTQVSTTNVINRFNQDGTLAANQNPSMQGVTIPST